MCGSEEGLDLADLRAHTQYAGTGDGGSTRCVEGQYAGTKGGVSVQVRGAAVCTLLNLVGPPTPSALPHAPPLLPHAPPLLPHAPLLLPHAPLLHTLQQSTRRSCLLACFMCVSPPHRMLLRGPPTYWDSSFLFPFSPPPPCDLRCERLPLGPTHELPPPLPWCRGLP